MSSMYSGKLLVDKRQMGYSRPARLQSQSGKAVDIMGVYQRIR